MAEVVRYAGVDLRSAGLYMSLADGVLSPPPVRGKNVLIPYQQGQRWVPKYYDERHIVLAGELFSVTSRSDFQAKVDTLKALFPIGAGEQKLEVQRTDGSFRYCMAEVLNTMGLQWLVFPTRSSGYSIELVASDPIWYDSATAGPPNLGLIAWVLDSGVFLNDGAHWFDSPGSALFATTLVQQATVVAARNPGTAPSRKPVFSLSTASMSNPKVTNLTNGLSVQVLNTTLAEKFISSVVIDCGLQTLTVNGIPVPSNVIALGSGQTDWMRLESGDNQLLVDLGLAGSASYKLTFQPSYL